MPNQQCFPRKIDAWETTDDSIFKHKAQAVDHQIWVDLNAHFTKQLVSAGQSSNSDYGDMLKIKDYVLNNRHRLYSIMRGEQPNGEEFIG
jgi:hypothetical protein